MLDLASACPAIHRGVCDQEVVIYNAKTRHVVALRHRITMPLPERGTVYIGMMYHRSKTNMILTSPFLVLFDEA